MSIFYSGKLRAPRRIYNDAMVHVANIENVIYGENVIYADVSKDGRTRTVIYGIYGQERGKSLHISMPSS
jgi:hypothetical protein